MKLVICGAGVIGSNLGRYLAEEGHEVNLIEQDEKAASQASEKLDVKVLVGSASDPSTLELAGVAEAPDEVAAQAIAKVLAAPGSREVADFADDKVLLRSFDIPAGSPLTGIRLEDLKERDFPWPFLVVAINRNGRVIIPRGEDTVSAGDRIYVLLPKPSLPEFLTFVHPEVKLPRKVIVYGATNTGVSLSMNLVDRVATGSWRRRWRAPSAGSGSSAGPPRRRTFFTSAGSRPPTPSSPSPEATTPTL
jgi:Trk K+ transport system NAD-binding subunit